MKDSSYIGINRQERNDSILREWYNS